MRLRFLILIIPVILCFSSNLYSQEITEPSYKLEFLKATYEEFPDQTPYSNQIVLYFKYSKKKNEKTLMSMRIKYKTNDDEGEIIENIEGSRHSITVYGDTHTKKKPHKLYEILKNQFKFNKKTKGEDFIFAFYLRDITDSYIPTMDFAYGLWEPANEKVRIEKNYNIDIQKK